MCIQTVPQTLSAKSSADFVVCQMPDGARTVGRADDRNNPETRPGWWPRPSRGAHIITVYHWHGRYGGTKTGIGRKAVVWPGRYAPAADQGGDVIRLFVGWEGGRSYNSGMVRGQGHGGWLVAGGVFVWAARRCLNWIRRLLSCAKGSRKGSRKGFGRSKSLFSRPRAWLLLFNRLVMIMT